MRRPRGPTAFRGLAPRAACALALLACLAGPGARLLSAAGQAPAPEAARSSDASAATEGKPAPSAPAPAPAALALPTRLTDAEFWALVSEISEPGGFFRITDNYTSNEFEVGPLSSKLRATGVKGGVYVGVGPEQNYSYIAAIRPSMAFIVDIRRQAVVQHLLFKAIFELSPERADFIATLFSKPRPPDLDANTPIQRIWEAFQPVATSHDAGVKTFARVLDLLRTAHGFTLTPDELGQLRDVFDAFQAYGPSITTRGGVGGFGGGNSMSFEDLTGWSLDLGGEPQSFLSTEDNYRAVKALHEKNLIVPVSGDFAGPKALRAVGANVKPHEATVSAF